MLAINPKNLTKTFLFFLILNSALLAQGVKFVHTATVSNIISNWTVIDNALLNGNPNAIFFVTQNWNPDGTGGVYNDASIGVWYDGSHWAIFNQDISDMPEGASFNIFIHNSTNDFVHTATISNIISNWTVIDNPSLNGNPNAIFFVTQNWNPGGATGVYNNAPIGVWYDGSHWAIFNQDISNMPEGASFNIFIHNGADDFVHIATTTNIISNWTVIDNPALNGNPNAMFFATQNWNPVGSSGVYNNTPIGVWYDGSHWAIFNQDISNMPEGASFNVYLASSGVTDVALNNHLVVKRFELDQNYPNPFNPTTTINYQIPEISSVTLKVYDVLGNEIATLVNEEKPAGSYEVNFNASGLASGIYFYKLQSGSFIETKKMILLK